VDYSSFNVGKKMPSQKFPKQKQASVFVTKGPNEMIIINAS
jgi:hypothetical protein